MTEAAERVVRVGCAGLPQGTSREAFFRRVPLLEVDTLPKPNILRRWRKEGAHTLLWRLDSFELPAARWKELLESADVLGAEVLVLQTPPSFSPSSANRDSMKRFFGEVVGDPGERVLAWEPRGTWEATKAARLAAELGVLHAYDPLLPEPDEAPPPPPTEEAYYRLYGLGLQRNRLSDERLAELTVRVAEHARAWVVFANVERFKDAQRFAALWAAFAAESE
jgi:uncharacterized protein YecE (DUF72 family)